MAIPCRNCGAEPRDGARFCDACGSPLAAADSRAEYKQVTVLFADVVHSMDIAAAVGPERLRELMGELFKRSSAIVQRYGGTVDKFTGDGIMAVFGAPIALEDHALRACRAALDIQKDVKRLSDEVELRDHVKLQMRVGLNSGEVITGEIGSGPLSYTAVGEQVGMAQRMESVAVPGGVMVSESTARLVENATILGDAELVHIKGAQFPVSARRLLAVATGRRTDRVETTFVGRQREMDALSALLDQAIGGNGSVVGLTGSPGMGKSRIVREIASRATNAGFEVFTTYCESHMTDVPFHAAAGLLLATTGAGGLDDEAARARVRDRFTGADEEDLLILEDLLGIGDPVARLPLIDPDARRRRVTAMVKAAALARSTPTVYVIEDAHWIDEISESMLADFLAVIARTRALVVVTYRPEYVGALADASRSQTIVLEPLDDSQMSELSAELLGKDRSVTPLAGLVTEHAGGNPFFAEEIVRDLTERDVLIGGRGCYLCVEPATDVIVPSTLQAVIASRIDRLEPAAKRALNAAAVVGSQFSSETLRALEIEPVVEDLVLAELIDQREFGPPPQYAFRHGLVRAVAYESQLKSDRAHLHRRVAETIEQTDQNAALIAEHLEAAGDLHGAYEWHMRAGAWSTSRDIAAAQTSWLRARQVADRLPEDDPDRVAMRIAPRTLLCTSAWRVGGSGADTGFDELRELCRAAGDQASLAIGMSGQVVAEFIKAHRRAASRLASEHTELLESFGDPTLIAGPFIAAIAAKHETAEMTEALRLAERVIEVAGDDRTQGDLILGSPLAWALAMRGAARWCLGISGWQDDFAQAAATARSDAPTSLAFVIFYTYVLAISNGALLAGATALHDTADALAIAERSGDEMALRYARGARGITLAHQDGPEREAGFEQLAEVREAALAHRFALVAVPVIDLQIAREKARSGDLDGAIRLARAVADDLFDSGGSVWSPLATAVLVETLLRRVGENDMRDAAAELDRLVALPFEPGFVLREVWLLRLRALLAKARGDDTTYREYRDLYRATATEFGYEGHMAWAAEMP